MPLSQIIRVSRHQDKVVKPACFSFTDHRIRRQGHQPRSGAFGSLDALICDLFFVIKRALTPLNFRNTAFPTNDQIHFM